MDRKTIAQAFCNGKVIIFPTDTVWGIGCSLECPESIKKIYKIKGRSHKQPTAVLIDSLQKAKKLGKFSHKAEVLAKKIWPGKVTLIVPARAGVPKGILGTGKKIGLRVPNHSWLLQVLQRLPFGLVASSANFSGEPAPLKKTMLNPELVNQADLIVGKVRGGGSSASTVIDTTVTPMRFIRIGEIKLKDILSD